MWAREDETTRLLKSTGDAFTLPVNREPSGIKICIVGGGVAGIVALRVLKTRGFTNIILYEAGSRVSGVWSQGYPGYAIQTPGELYEFPDKPLSAPKDYKQGTAIQKYCEDYCTEHQLHDLIHLNHKVTSISCKATPQVSVRLVGYTTHPARDILITQRDILSIL